LSSDLIIDLRLSIFRLSLGYIFICDVKDRILFLNSLSNPFMTDNTVIRIPTPSIRPMIDTLEIIDMNDKLYLENNNLNAISRFI
tara:strand:+ start:268 stop:522 length:255 start_codon:yes stop_codon:yes gene_type:complete